VTASITVCQSQPSSTATSAMLRPCRPTCVAHRPAPDANKLRDDPIIGSASAHDRPHDGHRHRLLNHTNLVGRPNTGRSRASPPATVTMRRRPTRPTPRSRRRELDRDPQRPRPLADAQHAHGRKADQQRAHARRIRLQQGLPETRRRRTPPRIAEPLCRARDLPHTVIPPTDPKRHQ
jgi:hypothetical protein